MAGFGPVDSGSNPTNFSFQKEKFVDRSKEKSAKGFFFDSSTYFFLFQRKKEVSENPLGAIYLK